jgi:carbonic anhydrase/acetyltransferase-like protein (isoleucine patch superfamily)
VHGDWNCIHAVPQIGPEVWIAPGAVIYGRVRLQERSSVWYQCVLRGDHEWIDVGPETNIQDGSVIHVDPGVPCVLGPRVTVGHKAVVP